ncbi:MAG: formylglycine-generating enzyme family protein [Planctomycetes bacterium]|nr:formylglycine-generating enzyme family protein [Planctomycetota bacterium]
MRTVLIAACALIAGCGTGSGGGSAIPGVAGGTGVAGGVADTRAAWQVVDLASGLATPQAAVPDLAANPAYRDRLMAFRLVPGGAAALGQAPGSFARQEDEPPRTALVAPCYLAAFECTRAQWRRLGGGAPWEDPALATLAGSGDDLPAIALGPAAAQAGLAAWNAGHGPHLALPSADEWEAAARAGGGGAYPWGDEHRASAVAAWAVTAEGGATAPQPVGRRLANALGLHDLAGNVWELTADGWVRGGSWADPLSLARCANRREIPADGWATAGLRLVWRP